MWNLGMGLKTKSIYEPSSPGDGVRILITRFYPRGVKKERFDRWVKALSPSRELVLMYKRGGKTWSEFARSFHSELMSSSEAAEQLLEIHELAKSKEVTLLCYEKAGENCHRFLVEEILTTPKLFSAYVERFYPRQKLGRKAK